MLGVRHGILQLRQWKWGRGAGECVKYAGVLGESEGMSKFACSKVESGGILAHNEPGTSSHLLML